MRKGAAIRAAWYTACWARACFPRWRAYICPVSTACSTAWPVFIGDVLTVSGTVTEVNETFREITVKAVITNQNGQKVTRGVIRAGVAV